MAIKPLDADATPAPRQPDMQAALFIDEPAWDARHHRLAVCMAISACTLFLVIATVDWPALFELPRIGPLELEITLRRPPETKPEDRELPPPETRRLPAPATPATREPTTPAAAVEPAGTVQPAAPAQTIEPAKQAEAAERPAVSTPRADAPAARVDWYAELERAAAEVGARAAAEPKSMHPEFDELRRIAAQRYGKPRTNKPAPAWEVEKDPYGRTLLTRGNSYIVLDDPRLFNQYAFETFEKHMVFFTIPFGKAPPENLPWVETIRARYEYLREPDELPPLKVVPAHPDPE